MMQDPNVNLHETQKAFKQYVEKYKADFKQKNGTAPLRVPGYKQFKRWEWFMSPRVSQTGERFAPDAVWQAMNKYNEQYPTGAGNWTFIGPSNTSALSGAGRLNCIRIHPTNSNTLYVGAPSGGLWISANGGSSWTTNTDKLNQVIGCTDIAFDPTDPNIMYMATGDGDAGDNYTVGLLKSTDGAATWNPTGLSFSTAQFRQISKVLVDPSDGNNVIVATSGGIYRSADAAISFTQVQTGSFKDMEFKPGTPSTMYACGAVFHKSTNGGLTWTKITTGLPDSVEVSRMAIAVTQANANTLYLVAMNATTNDMKGVYKSTNSGSSFSYLSAPNIGNQGWYDLCIAASPTNANELMLGGQTQFLKSTSGGTTWSQIALSTHVDYHDIVYTSGTTVYLTSDGGVWKSTNSGTSWTDLSNNLEISQMYGFGQSVTDPDLLIQGWQDNGTNIYDGTWSSTMGGDGMLAFISWNNDNYMWGSQYEGSLNRSTNKGNTWTSCATITETCPWVTQWSESPITANTIYAGCENVWVSNNGGQYWINNGDVLPGNTSSITALAVSPANPSVMWTAKGGTLYNCIDGGSYWPAVTTLPSGTITDIACHQTDEKKAWVTFSGFTNSNKVFETEDMGLTWKNLSPSLPNIPVNCIAVDKNTNALYVGTDAGVFFKDTAMSVWQPFSNGLPNVVVTQLEIFYAGNKIRCSTYGRGMWESGFYVPGAYPPQANFGGNNLIGCPSLGVQYSDYSSGQPTSWNWAFPGGTPSSSTEQNPFVGYNSPGTYSVSLIATNANGVDSISFVNYISIGSSPYLPPVATGGQFCSSVGQATITANPSGGGTIRWWDQPAGGAILDTGNNFSTFLSQETDTFYADESFPNTNPDVAGMINRFGGTGSFFTANDIRGLYFDVLEPVVITSFDVYANSEGYRTIEILDENGSSFYETTVNIPASPNTPATVLVYIPIYAGNNYFIKFRGLVDCYRNNAGAVYPMISSAINITESNASVPGYYYFFYNWQYSKAVCNTARTECIVTDTCFSTIGTNDLFAKNSIDVFPNPASDEVFIRFSGNQAKQALLELCNSLGQIVYQAQLPKNHREFSFSAKNFPSGVYFLTIKNEETTYQKKLSILK